MNKLWIALIVLLVIIVVLVVLVLTKVITIPGINLVQSPNVNPCNFCNCSQSPAPPCASQCCI